MKLDTVRLPHAIEIHVTGRAAAIIEDFPDAFRNLSARLIEEGDIHLLVNLDVTVMNSWGFGAIVEAYAKATDLGGDLAVYSSRENIQRLFAILKCPRIFFGSRDAALSHLLREIPEKPEA